MYDIISFCIRHPRIFTLLVVSAIATWGLYLAFWREEKRTSSFKDRN